MKILFLIRSLNLGGAERQLVLLAKGLHERGHSIQVATFYSGGPLENDLKESGVSVFSLEKRRRWDLFPFFFRLLSVIAKVKPDLLHSYLPGANLVAILVKPFFPRLKIVWGERASELDYSRYDRLARVTDKLASLLSRFADLIIANSEAGKQDRGKSGFPSHKMVVIPNGIDTDKFRPDPELRKSVRAEWSIGEEEKLIGLVGRLDPMKDHVTFLKAVALLKEKRKDVRCVCVGDGPPSYKTGLLALAEKLGLEGRVVWAGSRSDMVSVYNAMDLLCSASSFGEGFSNVVAEAMSCGVPCVVTAVGDSARIVGQAGVTVPPCNPDALMIGMNSLLSEKDEGKRKEEARKRVVERFGAEQMVRLTENALKV